MDIKDGLVLEIDCTSGYRIIIRENHKLLEDEIHGYYINNIHGNKVSLLIFTKGEIIREINDGNWIICDGN